MLTPETLGLEIPADYRWVQGGHGLMAVWIEAEEGLRSTGFGPYKRKDVEGPRRHLPLLRSCEALYDRLVAHALTPAGED